MENETQNREDLINSFCEITSSSREEASFFLESHQWILDSAVSTFLDDAAASQFPADNAASFPSYPSPGPAADYTQSAVPTLPTTSPSPAPPSGSRRAGRQSGGNVHTMSELNQMSAHGSDSDSDEPQEYYAGGQKSGMLVQDPKKVKDVDSIFDQARQLAVERPVEQSSSSVRNFTGVGRLLSGETIQSAPAPQQPETVTHTITLWQNGFTVDNGPLRRFDDPANGPFLESISNSECPRELAPANRATSVHVDMIRREENYTEPAKQQSPFQGTGRTLGSSMDTNIASVSDNTNAPPQPSNGPVVDASLPVTSIQLRLSDGTRLVSSFNYNHTVRDIRGFIDASRPGGRQDYQLLTMGFPPKKLTDLDQKIEQAGIANSVLLQKF